MKRPVTNLRGGSDFPLSIKDINSGFVCLLRSKPNAGRSTFGPTDLYATIVANLGEPLTRKYEIKGRTKFSWLESAAANYAARSSLRRVGTAGFEYTFCIAAIASGDAGIQSIWNSLKFLYEEHEDVQASNVTTIELAEGSRTWNAPQLLNILNVPAGVKLVLSKCLKDLTVKLDGQTLTYWLTLKIDKAESEYINSASLAEVKISTFYSMLVMWASSQMGATLRGKARLPEVVTSVSKISQSIAKAQEHAKVVPRTGIDGIIVDIHGRYLLLPEHLDNTQMYEQQMIEFGTREDGSYSYMDPKATETININELAAGLKMPANIPILLDWLNDKFAYSNSSGHLAVFDLGTTVPMNNFHIRKLLDVIASDYDHTGIWEAVTTAISIGASIDSAVFTEHPLDDLSAVHGDSIERYRSSYKDNSLEAMLASATAIYRALVNNGDEINELTVSKFTNAKGEFIEAPTLAQFSPKVGLSAYKFIGRMMVRSLKAIEANMEKAFQKYSVITVYNSIGLLRTIIKYAEVQHEVIDKDNAERDVYINQGIDPEYPVEALPNIKEGLAYMPHQARVHNRMRKGPKFAIWKVDAGGGKSILTLTNILAELKNKRCTKPVICCPAHLVAQYISETVDFNHGKLNLIPVTNATLKVHGYEHLARLIEMAPINTVVITDFNFLKGKTQKVSYGNKTLMVYKNAEFLRQFGFDLVVVDEVHYLKNLKSGRRNAAYRFLQDIPMKRLASGTFVADTLVDVVSQTALLDPTIFGSVETFTREFAAETKGAKISQWRPGAEREIASRLGEHVVECTAKRKEWAALLPKSQERFVMVEFSEMQRSVYEAILQETVEIIEQALAKNPEMQEMMESEDEAVAEELESLLRPYMSRLERYLSNPENDVLSEKVLKGEDLVSPKALKIYDICREHLNGNMEGKILIFTQYTASAEHVVKHAPPDLAPFFIHYTADRKTECKAEYESNPQKRIMIGVSSSMDTGLNLQMASRLIRMETVWTPGVLEQGNARINRPTKKTDTRTHVYFDWLVVNKTVDITKVSRLVSKVMSKTLFDEYDNPAYDGLEAPPSVAMTIDSIRSFNDARTTLLPYLETYAEYQRIRNEDYEAYKQANPEGTKFVPVPVAPNLEGSKLISRLPYVPSMELYGAAQLGLVRYDHFMRTDMSDIDEDDDGDDEGDEGQELTPEQIALKEERSKMTSRPVHTEFGDGSIRRVGRKNVWVDMPDGTVKRIAKMRVFVITRSETNNIDMRNELLKQVGKIPLDQPIVVPVTEGRADSKRKKKATQVEEVEVEIEEDTSVHMNLSFTVVNDFLSIWYSSEGDENPEQKISILQNFGFTISPDYVYAHIRTAKHLLTLFRAFKEHEFRIDKETSATFKEIWLGIKGNRNALKSFGFATSMEMKIFQRQQIRPSSSPDVLKIYPLIQDGKLYVAMPLKGQPATRAAMKIKPLGIQWHEAGGTAEVLKFCKTKREAQNTLKDLINNNVTIDNIKSMEKQYNALKMKTR